MKSLCYVLVAVCALVFAAGASHGGELPQAPSRWVDRAPQAPAIVPATVPAQQWISYDGGRTWQPYTPGVADAPSLPAAMPVQSWGSVSGGGCANGQCSPQSSGFFRRR